MLFYVSHLLLFLLYSFIIKNSRQLQEKANKYILVISAIQFG